MKYRPEPSIADFPDWTITVSAESEVRPATVDGGVKPMGILLSREEPIFMIVAKRGGRKLVSTGDTITAAWKVMVKLLRGVS